MRQERKLNDDETLLKMHEEGKGLKEIGKHFGCSAVAVHKRLKRLLPGPADAILEDSGLTDQQKNFCLAKADGATNTQAALASYECTTGVSARNIGCQLMANESVKETIERLMEVHGLTRSYRIGKLRTHVDNRDPDVSLKAIDMSFKLDDSYPAQKNISLTAQ